MEEMHHWLNILSHVFVFQSHPQLCKNFCHSLASKFSTALTSIHLIDPRKSACSTVELCPPPVHRSGFFPSCGYSPDPTG